MCKKLKLFVFLAALWVQARAQDTVYLGTPGSRPFMTVFRAEGKVIHTAVIVCSGGSYGRTADMEEGLPAAKLLASSGITAFLLDYRVPMGHDSVPLADAQAAIAWVREHAGRFRARVGQIGIMGFSAGGHLAATVGTHFQDPYGEIPVSENLRPDFMVLVYPVISMTDALTHSRSRRNFLGDSPSPEQIREFSNELQVTPQTPPAFIVAAVDDPVVKVANSLLFSAALRQQGIQTELFLYASGGHGFGIHNQTATIEWTDAAIRWIKNGAWKAK
jgi:acetyl esterase/lipase